jgi:ribonuclease/clavin/mitogillin
MGGASAPPSKTLKAEPLSESVWRIPLPSRTLPPYDHTNSYLVQTGEMGSEGVLIDLGTDDPETLAALATFLDERGVTTLRALLLTHSHPDHCAGAAEWHTRYGTPVYAHPLERAPLSCPSEPLEDGETLFGLRAYHTPGHSPGHLSFAFDGVLLVGDLLAAEGSTWVGVPGGDVAAYLASLERLERVVTAHDSRILGPGHGENVYAPLARLGEVRRHRLAREAEILSAVQDPRTFPALREAVYPDLPAGAAQAAEGSLLAHLEKLVHEHRVEHHPGGVYSAVRPDPKQE